MKRARRKPLNVQIISRGNNMKAFYSDANPENNYEESIGQAYKKNQ